jgi:hypothetical protein
MQVHLGRMRWQGPAVAAVALERCPTGARARFPGWPAVAAALAELALLALLRG